ncbi:receptor-type tyrosine-protein phosphatase F-like isoform X3 [Stylophora pistillata]|uniref:receptor-type tyrosine-protein phosphatase F-like isoform X3 n=1 Tax=Stylophora pistillata TaxID=50429 RepID=UPI000C04E931|nr:receptor-type tyrosine-protein phosphatase F-like isoform X3 [Stylophora pistillata]
MAFAGSFYLNITSGSTLRRLVAGLDMYTEYEFQVLAYTSDGDGPKSFVEVERTMEAAPSQPPSNFKVTATSSTSVTASWQLPPEDSRNGIIKGFKLFYKRKDSSGSGNILTINSESTLDKDVNGLDEYTEYDFRVLAFTSAGDGVNSSVVRKRTKEDVPSQPPNGFTLTATTSTSITASWQLPPADSRNGIITGFKLFYKKKGSLGSPNEQLIGNKATRTKEVTGLNKYTEYEFQILAFTSVGDGTRSAAVFKKTKEDAPSQPPSQFIVTVNSSTSITASWKLPLEHSRHGNIIGFKLYYKKNDSSSATSLTINNGNTSATRVNDLDKYTKYDFQVLAFTSAGDGPNSSVVFRTTMEDAPSAPTSLSYVGVPPSSSHGPRIILSWSKPTEPNGVIRSYNLFYRHDGGAPVNISGIDKNALSHTVDVLGGVTYQFHVRAVTIRRGPNQTITVTTKEYEPSRGPEEISSSALNSTNINITWLELPREVAYGKVIRYEVRLTVVENCTKIQFAFHSTINTTITYVLVTGLSLCAKYEVSVRGYTAVGPGPYSRPVMVQTLGKPIIKDLPKRTIIAIGELVVLTCEVSGDPEASVTWTKDGLTSLARAQLENNAKVLFIPDVVPGDSGVYECKAVNMFGESRTATIVIVAVPPRIIEELSPSSVICEKQTPCFLSCQATSYIPFNSSWTKDGQVPTGDNVKLLNNSLIVTPRDAQDYGDYLCHATNTFGSTIYKITLVAPTDNQDLDDDTQSSLLAGVIALSFIVFVLLIIICGLVWQRRRAVPDKRIQSKEEIDFDGVKSSPDQLTSDEQSSDPNTYMELKPRPSNQESHVPSEYQLVQEKLENPGYYNMVLQKESGGKQNEEVYEEI